MITGLAPEGSLFNSLKTELFCTITRLGLDSKAIPWKRLRLVITQCLHMPLTHLLVYLSEWGARLTRGQAP